MGLGRLSNEARKSLYLDDPDLTVHFGNTESLEKATQSFSRFVVILRLEERSGGAMTRSFIINRRL